MMVVTNKPGHFFEIVCEESVLHLENGSESFDKELQFSR